MSTARQHAIVDTMAYLAEVQRDQALPHEAEARLRMLQARHPETSMQLVWEREAFDETFHYDVLVRTPEHLTVSISVCAERALPWPLRGVHRWQEADLVRVNGTVMSVQQAVAFLDFVWGEAPVAARLVDVCLIEEELARNPIVLSDEELQLGLDAFRRAKGLYDAAATHAWMRMRDLTHAQLERVVADHLIVARLRDRIADGRVEEYFKQHRAAFDMVQMARIECSDEASARRVRDAIDTVGFYEVAERTLLEDTSCTIPVFALLRRREAADPLGAALFAAEPGELVGPIQVGQGYAVARVIARAPAQLDDITRGLVKQQLFDDWLAERRVEATIAWNWGRVREDAIER